MWLILAAGTQRRLLKPYAICLRNRHTCKHLVEDCLSGSAFALQEAGTTNSETPCLSF
jgi:hypothetical protein